MDEDMMTASSFFVRGAGDTASHQLLRRARITSFAAETRLPDQTFFPRPTLVDHEGHQ
jgi:hypothetical protein